jgi:FPC/CPF motif-containing protein YcgG
VIAKSNVVNGGLIHWTKRQAEKSNLADDESKVLTRAKPAKLRGGRILQIEKFVGSTLEGFLSSHPCIGARHLASDSSFFYAVYGKMVSMETSFQFLLDIDQYFTLTDDGDKVRKSMLCIFLDPISSQQDFSSKFWQFAQTTHDLDSLTHQYAADVSSDPDHIDFEISFRSRAIFPTTLHPAHERAARRYQYPGWALNQTSQFNELRSQGQFEVWQRKIRAADSSLDESGVPNPLLADTGTGSAANQIAALEEGRYPFSLSTQANRKFTLSKLKDKAKDEEVSEALTQFLDGF